MKKLSLVFLCCISLFAFMGCIELAEYVTSPGFIGAVQSGLQAGLTGSSSGSSGSSYSQSTQRRTVRILNNTGYPVKEIHIRDADGGKWNVTVLDSLWESRSIINLELLPEHSDCPEIDVRLIVTDGMPYTNYFASVYDNPIIVNWGEFHSPYGVNSGLGY